MGEVLFGVYLLIFLHSGNVEFYVERYDTLDAVAKRGGGKKLHGHRNAPRHTVESESEGVDDNSFMDERTNFKLMVNYLTASDAHSCRQ